MAARYAKLTLRASWAWDAFVRGIQTQEVRFKLGGQWVSFFRGGQPGQFTVPAPGDIQTQREFVLQGVNNLLVLLRQAIVQRGLPYTVSAARDTGDAIQHIGESYTSQDVIDPQHPWPMVEFDITALVYDSTLDLAFSSYASDPTGGGASDWRSGWEVLLNQSTIKPVIVSVQTQPAGIYGTATGSAVLTADGNGAPYAYQWADGFVGASRPNMAAGQYYCTVTDVRGEFARALVTITSDPLLEVQVNSTPNSVTLVPRGGWPPYAYAWADGPTTATRTGLTIGTYHCVVSDARGATCDVEVIIADHNRYWFSGNSIPLSLDAGQAYRDDPTTKPGLSFVLQVWVEPDYLSGTFLQVGQEMEQPADADGRTIFEIQELLEPFVAALVPAVDQVDVVRQEGLFCRFFLQHHERTTAGDGVATTVEPNYLLHVMDVARAAGVEDIGIAAKH